jgi:dienelactone hydrolase
MADELPGFERSRFTHDGKTKAVYRAGSGPGVIVIHEMPGITPEVAAFGRRVADAGFTAVMPSLFGTPGKPLSIPYALRTMIGGCVSREFTTFAKDKTSPISAWLRALAKETHERCGGPGVGVVGMCFTGGFALGMMAEPAVIAPALSQPSLPFPVGKKRAASAGISPRDMATLKQRCAAEDICVMGMRFTNDPLVRRSRFDTLERELGENFIRVEIDSSPGNPYGNPKSAHSVLTMHLVDEPGHPTREALDGLLAFFGERLKGSGEG